MIRFDDQPLPARPHLAVLFYDAIGDFVVATPLLRGLREKYVGATIDYYSGERTRELEAASPLVDTRYSVFRQEGDLALLTEQIVRRQQERGPYDLAINCDDHPVLAWVTSMLQPTYVVGKAYSPDWRGLLDNGTARVDRLAEENWSSPDLLQRYPELETSYISEILCRQARVITDFARTEVPTREPAIETPSILISTGGKRSAKLWPQPYWRSLIDSLEGAGFQVGLLGDVVANQLSRYHSGDSEELLLASTGLIDMRGKLSLPEVAGALRRASLCISVDNGLMHMAGAVGTPTLGLFGASPWRVWVHPRSSIEVMLGSEPCQLCLQNRFRNEHCLRERQVCLLSLTPERVAARAIQLLRTA